VQEKASLIHHKRMTYKLAKATNAYLTSFLISVAAIFTIHLH